MTTPSPLSPQLEAINLSKQFHYPTPTTIFKGVHLTAYPGDSIAICGRSGEGKSTLLQILGTLDSPTEGSLMIAGHKVTSFNLSALRSKYIGFIFQSFCLLEDLTVLDNVLMPASIARQPISKKSVAYQRALSLLDMVGLSNRAYHHAKMLSGGEKQRAAIARALCNDPTLLLADEPTGNLDKENADDIHELLLNLCNSFQKTLIVVTHDQELSSLCSRTFYLQKGKLL